MGENSLRPAGPWHAAWRLGWRILRIPLLAYLLVMLLAMWFENSLIFFPSKYPAGDWTPRGIRFEDAWFSADDGVKLHGWYVACDNPVAVVLFCHGNGGNLTHRADLMWTLHHLGASVLAFDYRGYGRSEGSPDEPGILADARAARAWLARRAGVPELDIVLMGESLGGAVAVDLAAADGARGLVLENTFTSLPDMAAHHYPWLPVRLLMRSRLDSLSKIGGYRGPLLQIHGDADNTVPYAFGVRLHEAAHEPKRLITVRGGDHNDPRPESVYRALREFLHTLGVSHK